MIRRARSQQPGEAIADPSTDPGCRQPVLSHRRVQDLADSDARLGLHMCGGPLSSLVARRRCRPRDVIRKAEPNNAQLIAAFLFASDYTCRRPAVNARKCWKGPTPQPRDCEGYNGPPPPYQRQRKKRDGFLQRHECRYVQAKRGGVSPD